MPDEYTDRELQLISMLITTVRDTTAILTELRKSVEYVQDTCSGLPDTDRIDEIKGILLHADTQLENLTKYIASLGTKPGEVKELVQGIKRDMELVQTTIGKFELHKLDAINASLSKLIDYVGGERFQKLIVSLETVSEDTKSIRWYQNVRLPFVVAVVMFVPMVLGWWLLVDQMKIKVDNTVTREQAVVQKSISETDKTVQALADEVTRLRRELETLRSTP